MTLATGEVSYSRSVGVDYLEAPTEDEWATIEEDRAAIASRVLNMYSLDALRESVAAGTVGVYMLSENGETVGTMALEMVNWNGQGVLSVLWLRVTPGKLSDNLKRALRNSWKRIVAEGNIRHVVIQGRPGWESILINAGVEPRELARIWTFKSSEL